MALRPSTAPTPWQVLSTSSPRKDFEGVDVDLGYDITDESDGDQYNMAVTFGSTFDRGNFVLSGQVTKREAIRQGDRGFSACPFFDDGTQKICGGSPTTTPAQFVPLVDDVAGGWFSTTAFPGRSTRRWIRSTSPH